MTDPRISVTVTVTISPDRLEAEFCFEDMLVYATRFHTDLDWSVTSVWLPDLDGNLTMPEYCCSPEFSTRILAPEFATMANRAAEAAGHTFVHPAQQRLP